MKILVLDKIDDKAIDRLNDHFDVDLKTGLREQEIIQTIPLYHAIIVRSATKVTSSIIDAASNLQIIGRAGAGVDNIDVDHASKKQIAVMNAPGANAQSVAEHAFGLMLSLARGVLNSDHQLREGVWKKTKGSELQGKTLGIVGFGRIGKIVARIAAAFEMEVIAYDKFASFRHIEEHGAIAKDLDEVFTQSDFITLHLPLTEETHHMINNEVLSKMKNSAFLINTSRGGVINEEHLYEALISGEIAGAALDVYNQEPLGESPLLALDNVVLTTHISGSTHEAQFRTGMMLADQMIDFLLNQEKTNVINAKELSEHGFPQLRMLKIDDVQPHEFIERVRVDALKESLLTQNVLRNPIIVTQADDGYMIVDGTTRHAALKELGAKHIVAQVINYKQAKLELQTWIHGFDSKYFDQFKEHIKDFAILEQAGVSVKVAHEDSDTYVAHDDEMYKVVYKGDKAQMLKQLHTALAKTGKIKRVTVDQVEHLDNGHAYLIWPKLEKADIMDFFRDHKKVPAGISRHLIPCRVIGLSVDLDVLSSEKETNLKEDFLKELVARSMRRGKVRFYNEPLYIFEG